MGYFGFYGFGYFKGIIIWCYVYGNCCFWFAVYVCEYVVVLVVKFDVGDVVDVYGGVVGVCFD